MGLSSEPPEMPGLFSALGAPEVVGLFLWELGKITSPALASAFVLI